MDYKPKHSAASHIPIGIAIVGGSAVAIVLALVGGYKIAEGIHNLSEHNYQKRQEHLYSQLVEIDEALDKRIQSSERQTPVDQLPDLVTDQVN